MPISARPHQRWTSILVYQWSTSSHNWSLWVNSNQLPHQQNVSKSLKPFWKSTQHSPMHQILLYMHMPTMNVHPKAAAMYIQHTDIDDISLLKSTTRSLTLASTFMEAVESRFDAINILTIESLPFSRASRSAEAPSYVAWYAVTNTSTSCRILLYLIHCVYHFIRRFIWC